MEMNKMEELERIDLMRLAKGVLKYFRHFWALVLVLTILGGCFMGWRSARSYRPSYQADAVFSVSINYNNGDDNYSFYYDSAAAGQAAASFPYIMNMDVTRELICQRLGKDYINGAITAKSIAGTNLFRLVVTSGDPQDAYDILLAAMEVYPQISRRVIGETQLVMTREPVLPQTPVNVRQWKRPAMMGAAAGFLLGMGVLVVLTILRKTVVTVEDVKKLANLNCLSRIPEVRIKRRKSNNHTGLVITRQRTETSFQEAIRLLRVRLLRALGGENEKIVLFTSSVPSEGKTSLAVNTALTLAKHNNKVLLVDADLRSPSVKKLLGIRQPSLGLGECLSGKTKEIKFNRYLDTNLYLFAGDQSIGKPTALLQQGKLNKIFRSLRPMFDYIIVDTPPCGVMADASVLSRHADKVVYVIREDYASAGQIRDGIQSISSGGGKICGFVMNRVSAMSSSRYGYGGKYGYGYENRYGYGKPRSEKRKAGTERPANREN